MRQIHITIGLGDCILYCQIYNLYRDTIDCEYILNKRFVLL